MHIGREKDKGNNKKNEKGIFFLDLPKINKRNTKCVKKKEKNEDAKTKSESVRNTNKRNEHQHNI